jgi:hypothetical protein
MSPARLILSTLLLTAPLVLACGAAHKVEDGGERVDRAIDKDIERGKREIHDVFTDDAGRPTTAPAADAGR